MSRTHGCGRRIMAATTSVVLLGGAIALAGIAKHPGPGRVQTQAFVSGAFTLSNSKGHGAILTVSDLAPGAATTGSVTLRNTGRRTGALALAPTRMADVPGPGRGVLSRALALRVADITSGSNMTVYAGTLGALRGRRLITLLPGDRRTYRFTASMPDTGAGSGRTGDNAYQKASVAVTYRWTLTQATDRACGNSLRGDARPNRLVGTLAGDRILGSGGADRIIGRAGTDCLYGGPGSDNIDGGLGRDRITGGSGADRIVARDGRPDAIDCGTGRDTAFVDLHDRVHGCEIVHRSRTR
ncbi:MAG: hypothetical protein JWO02_1743 [Solirubrobacterales bacterium]|nr:hypothetical protein [Solirubrobacterales bacterium]